MELFMLIASIVCFIILPVYFLYDMFANPIKGLQRARYMDGYQWDSWDDACDYSFAAAALAVFIVMYIVSFAWM